MNMHSHLFHIHFKCIVKTLLLLINTITGKQIKFNKPKKKKKRGEGQSALSPCAQVLIFKIDVDFWVVSEICCVYTLYMLFQHAEYDSCIYHAM